MVEHHASSVEHQFVLTTHLIDIHNCARVCSRALTHHVLTLVKLSAVKRRAVDVDVQRCASLGLLVHWAICLPNVFANGYAGMHACNGEQRKRSACSEIAIFVKHAVVRKQLLVVGAVQFSVGCNGCRIRKRSTCPIDKSKDSHTTLRCCNDVAHRLLVFGHEPRFQHQVFRRIPSNGKFGKDHNVAVGFVCRGVHLQDSARITSNIADNGVQLG